MEELARAELGIADKVMAKEGVVVELVTVGTNHVGQDPEGAAKLVTVPDPAAQTALEAVHIWLPNRNPAVLDSDNTFTASEESIISSRPGLAAADPRELIVQALPVVF